MVINFSVLVATADRPFLIEKCIKSIENQTKKPFEIIVIDQSYDDETKYLCKKFYCLKYLKTSVKNKSAAINLGLKNVSSEYIAIIDDDCIADINWLLNLEKSFIETSYSIVTGSVIAGEIEVGAKISRLNDNQSSFQVFKKGVIIPIFVLSGCNVAIHNSVFSTVGYFDTNFGPGSKFLSSDDNEWALRAFANDFEILYNPDAKVIHRSWRNEKEDIEQMTSYGFAAGAFFYKLKEESTFSYLYHISKLYKWLWFERIKYLFNRTKAKPFLTYSQMFSKGYKHCKAHFKS